MNNPANPTPTFSDRLRKAFKRFIDPVGAFLNRLGLTPNAITLLGLCGTSIGAYFIARGRMTTGGFILLASVLVDVLDGTMARLRGESSDFGAFVDSVSDRYAEFITFGGMLFYFLSREDYPGMLATFAATAGSVLVSYVKARAEGLGFEARVGILTRAERYLVLIPLLVFNQPFAASVLIAVLGNITALQRVWHVRSQGRARIREAQAKRDKA